MLADRSLDASAALRAEPVPWLKLALVAALYYAGAKLGMLTTMPEGMAIFWPPNAVVLAAILHFRGRYLLQVGALVVLTELVADVPTFSVPEALAFGLINFCEAALAARLLERWRFDRRFASLADLWKFVLAGPLAAAFCAALLGALVYSAFRGGGASYLEFARIWWFGDALGLVILTPLLLAFRPFGAPAAPGLRPGVLDAAVWAGAGAALAAFCLFPGVRLLGAQPGPVLMLPFVLFAAARYPYRWAALAVAAAAAVIVLAMTQGRQPFGPLPAREAVMQAQEFLFILALVGLGFSALLAQLRLRQAELEALNARLESRVAERTAALSEANRRLARLAAVDGLSGLANRRSFDEALAAELARSRRHGGALSLVMADLDSFKRVNDERGHAVGDEVIRAFARLLSASARRSDLVARYGGEEFAVLMPETTREQALQYAERVRAALAASELPEVGWPVTASFGVAQAEAARSAEDFVDAADQALYGAKKAGRNRVCVAPAPDAAPG